MRVIGFQRAVALLLLTIFFVVSGFYGFYYLNKDISKVQRELSLNQSDIAEMSDNIDRLRSGLEKFTTQKTTFEKIRKQGFFDPQNRVETRQRLNAMQKESRLLSAKYVIRSATTDKNEIAKEAGYKILNTNINFTLDAIEDSDIYNFIYLLNYGFPGQISITELTMTRDKEITIPRLQQIGVGDLKPIIKGDLKVNWRTMVPDDSLSISSQDQDKEGM